MTTARPRILALSLVLPLGCKAGEGEPKPAAKTEAAAQPARAPTPKLEYPKTKTVPHKDVLHGVEVADPYRWLEDLDGAETKQWVADENAVTFAHLDTMPERASLRARLTELWNYERFGIPHKEGGRYFFSKNDGLQNQSVLHWAEAIDAEPKVLLDPNTMAKDGTVALSGTAVSPDGKLIAYGIADAGSDWQKWRVREVDTGKDLPDLLEWVKFSGASWTKDGKGFYYSRYEQPKPGEELKAENYDQKLYYHKLGDPQAKDRLIYERKDRPKWQFGGEVTEDGKYLVIDVSFGTDPKNAIFYRELGKKPGKIVELLPAFDAEYAFVGNTGPMFYFRTDLEAERNRLIAIDVTKPDRESWQEIIPQDADTLRGVSHVGGRFVASYLHDAQSKVRVHDLAGKLEREIELPGIGSTGGFGGKPEDPETFFQFTSFSQPGAIYRYDVATGARSEFRVPKVAFSPEDYTTEQVFYASKDGTKIPMFLSYKKGTKPDGSQPTYLYGYGGFNAPSLPGFSVPNLVWMEMGGVYAVANLRGGGEYGRAWHEAGTKLKKQNVFDDFIAAAEYLKSSGWSKPERIAIGGRSNGGLLVGAVMTQRPELFGVALPGVGVLDMLRFDKFTIGWAWRSDYGSSDDPEEFKALYAYSPYHRLKPGTSYPATMIYTGDHDDRVVPAHSFKFASALQAAQAGPAPVLIRIETRAGHGAGKPTSKQIEEWADLWAFTAHHLGMKVPPMAALAKGGAKP